MSISAMAWAKRQAAGNVGRKAVLLVLADYATVIEEWEPEGADGRHYAWPGVARLARETEQSTRSVIRQLAELEAADLIRRERQTTRDGYRRPDAVILAVDDAGARPFPVDNPVDNPVEGAQVPDCHLGAKVTPEVSQGDNSDSRSYIPTNKEPRSLPTRGTRIPEPFVVTNELAAWYRANIGSAVDGRTEHEKFVDYWRAKTGQAAVKKDWPATWRNWMRTALERSGRRGPSSTQPPSAPRYPTAQERSQAQRDEWQVLAKEADAWITANGGDPEDHKLVFEVMERIKAQRANGSDSRTQDMYSEGDVIDGTVVAPREVTAGEGI